MIELKNVSKTYGTNDVLRQLNLSFESGKVYGVVGENGAGKTTLFRCIAGMESHGGEVKYDQGNLRHTLGFLATEPYLVKRITGREYLQWLCNARKVDIRDFNAYNIFDLPLDNLAEYYSTGMRKKLALTAILLQGNEVFILDEPFNGVDIQSNILITEVIRTLKNKKKLILISSHIFSTLTDTCDEILLLKDGKIRMSETEEGFAAIEEEMRDSGIAAKLEKLHIL